MKTKITPILALLCAVLSFISLSGQTTYTVLVSSRGESAVKEYDLAGNFLGNFVEPGSGGLSGTEDMLFHPDGSVLVTGFANTAIKRYDGASGDYLGNFTSGYSLNTPSKMSIGPDSLIYVTQWGATQNKVVRFDLNGAFVDEFTSVGAPNGLGHVWDVDKNFYVALYGNGGNGTVHKFDSLGNDQGIFITSFLLQGPTSIWWDSAGDMLVEDFTVGKVLRYNSQGQYQGEFIAGMTNPEGIAFLPNGNLLIGDWGEDAVHQFDSTGIDLGYFASGDGLTDPNSVKLRVVQSTSTKETEPSISSFSVSPTLGSDIFHIELTLSSPSELILQVLTMDGRVLETIAREKRSAGSHAFSWQPQGKIPAGIYLIQMQVDGMQRAIRIAVN